VQSRPFLVVEIVTAKGEDLVERHELDDVALGQVGGLVEHEPAVVDVSFERLHRFHSLVLLGLSGERGHKLGGIPARLIGG
jgi:hypothetical protein